MAVWSVEKQTWYIPAGEFKFSIGSSSRNLPLSTTLTVGF
jgi:beta-glucosidase